MLPSELTRVRVSSSQLLSSIFEAPTKNSGKHLFEATRENWPNETVFRFTKKSSILPRIAWAEESQNGLRFKIEPSYDDVPATPQYASDGQSSHTVNHTLPGDCSFLSCVRTFFSIVFSLATFFLRLSAWRHRQVIGMQEDDILPLETMCVSFCNLSRPRPGRVVPG